MKTGSLNLLKAHTSNDVTRYHLTGVYFDENHAVATDGHRLVKIDHKTDIELSQLGKNYSKKIFSLKDHITIDGSYPNYLSLFPKSLEQHTKLVYEIPEWFKAIKPVKTKGEGRMLYLTSHGFQLFRPENEPFVALNPGYVAPFAGLDCVIYFKGSTDPVVIHVKHDTRDIEALIMPMRV